jgi:RHS repeat-associated protein
MNAASSLQLRLPGQYLDEETGLHYSWNRYFDSNVGQYISSDPIGLSGGVNRYSYVTGNPTNRYDFNGLFCTSGQTHTTCINPDGPSFTLPRQPGFPDSLETGDDNPYAYHKYHVERSLGCAPPDAVMKKLIQNPTPGDPRPATPEGTPNNAVVLWQ